MGSMEDIKNANNQDVVELFKNAYQTPALCVVAVLKNPEAIKYVKNISPKGMYDYSFRINVVKKNGLLLRLFDENNQTDNICEKAIIQNGAAIQYVYKKTEYLCELAVKMDPENIKYIDQVYPRVYILALTKNIEVIKYFKYFNTEIIELALTKDGKCLQYIPKRLLTNELCMRAFQQNSSAFEFFPIEMKQSFEIQIKVILKDKTLINYMEPHPLTLEVYNRI
jgi:hypothetical protein